MAKFASEDLRNVGVIGHDDTGKTTLVSACLYTTGAVSRLGRVEDGHSTTDFDEEEIDRQISIQVGLAHAQWRGSQITFVDTPGYAVFRAETKGAMRVVDGALVTVDALSGAEVMTEKVWEYMRDLKVPGVIVINRLDRENGSFERAVESCVDSFGREVVALQLPIGAADKFRGVVDLLDMKAYTYAVDGDGKGTVGDVPDDMKDAAEALREALVEMVAESNEELMEIYFEEGGLTRDQLTEGVRQAVFAMSLFPVLCMSAAHNIGTDRVLDACLDFLPSPTDRRQLLARDEGEDVWIDAEADAPIRRTRLQDGLRRVCRSHQLCQGVHRRRQRRRYRRQRAHRIERATLQHVLGAGQAARTPRRGGRRANLRGHQAQGHRNVGHLARTSRAGR